jgi:hypothetical protein
VSGVCVGLSQPGWADYAPGMPDELENQRALEKLQANFALTLEVLRCVLRRSQGIQTTEAELRRSNEVLNALLQEYEVPFRAPER